VSIDGVNPFQVVQATGICSSHQRAPPWPRHRLVVGA
jgi:hypothetical protein